MKKHALVAVAVTLGVVAVALAGGQPRWQPGFDEPELSTKKITATKMSGSTVIDGPNVTVGGTLTASKGIVQTGETLTLTKGNYTLTPTQNVYYIAGHYGVVTLSLATASSQMEVEIINTVATNVVLTESAWCFATGALSVVGQWDAISYRSYSTNWVRNGGSDN